MSRLNVPSYFSKITLSTMTMLSTGLLVVRLINAEREAYVSASAEGCVGVPSARSAMLLKEIE
jgi:hypothetical protein